MENKIYYKVLIEKDDGGVSVWAEEEAEVLYRLNRWVEAPECMKRIGYHLLVFDSLKKAEYFAGKQFKDYVVIYECNIKNEIKNKPPRLFGWTFRHFKNKEKILFDWPEGTVMAEKVKLIKEIK